jgi:phosphopentomutase
LRQKKLILIVLDSVGVGELPDADIYGDRNANTISNTAKAVNGLRLPNLASLGIGNLTDIKGVPKTNSASGCYGKMAEASEGKDSTIGHWEIAGIITRQKFPLYPNGFPEEILRSFVRAAGCNGWLGNKPASGTEIINELGGEHVRTGFPIIYTSSDSVFQIAAHQDVIPLERLYEICRVAREQVLVGDNRIGRVIARPFIGENGRYARTPNRRDFAVKPPAESVLDLLAEDDVATTGIGKIDDLFCGCGLQEKLHTVSNAVTIEKIIDKAEKMNSGLLFANLVDFDMLFGHRQDAIGYANALEEFDNKLPDIQNCINGDDLLIITADHGNDPTDESTNHTREYVPLLCFSRRGKKNVNLGIRSTFADIGKTVGEFFSVRKTGSLAGVSFLREIF